MNSDNNYKNIKTEDYIYDLPVEQIAIYPLTNRDHSSLLYYNGKECQNKIFHDLPELLSENDLLVFNNTKVIRARLPFVKKTGAKIEIFCLEPHSPADFQLSFESLKSCQWKCLVGNLKKWKGEEIETIININKEDIVLKANKVDRVNESVIIEFSWNNPRYSFSEIIEAGGVIPIPPYLNRETETNDNFTYQTVYSKVKGSVAAPTAGLHFTENIFKKLNDSGISTDEVTLHVSAGTFKPVSSETIEGHKMHSEHFYISKNSITNLLNHNRIIAVGTTSVRTVESLYWLGVRISKGLIKSPQEIHVDQWDPYNLPHNMSAEESLENLLTFMKLHNLETIEGSTSIIIIPGYKFRLIKGLITNFHMPKSTLLLLIAALVGDDWRSIYNFALDNNYRFLSYGDSSLLLPSLR